MASFRRKQRISIAKLPSIEPSTAVDLAMRKCCRVARDRKPSREAKGYSTMIPKCLWKATLPFPVMVTTREPASRLIHSRLRKRSSRAAPVVPATWNLRSVQSRHLRTRGRLRLARKLFRSIPSSFNQRSPRGVRWKVSSTGTKSFRSCNDSQTSTATLPAR